MCVLLPAGGRLPSSSAADASVQFYKSASFHVTCNTKYKREER